MSERTTIGGTVYETVGSSKSNLLLKCNGTARIQWGNKLIDLIKNGKIASEHGGEQIFIIQNESDIKKEGLYVIDSELGSNLLLFKNNKKYDLTRTDLYISTIKQNITSEQKLQAMENIGMFYNTLEELQNAGLQAGIAYVQETKTLYTINDSKIEEFEAKLKTVEVKQESKEGEVINSSYKVVLQVLENDYLILESDKIIAAKPLYISKTEEFGSEGSSDFEGYRFYIQGNKSYLDVDYINVREGLPIQEYHEVTYENVLYLCKLNQLIPFDLYAIMDYQNPWKIPANTNVNNRPILLRALSENCLSSEGTLLHDRSVHIRYDINFQDKINYLQCTVDTYGNITNETVVGDTSAKGLITYMKDCYNNEANFDFLDYYHYSGIPLVNLHDTLYSNSSNKSVFPKGSHDNTLIIHNLYGTVFEDGNFSSDSYKVDFQIQDSPEKYDNFQDDSTEEGENTNNENTDSGNTDDGGNSWDDEFLNPEIPPVRPPLIDGDLTVTNPRSYGLSRNSEEPGSMVLHDNVIECYGLTVTDQCLEMHHVTINNAKNAIINDSITYSTFDNIQDTTINYSIVNSNFGNVSSCSFNCLFNDVSFKDLFQCIFEYGTIQNLKSRSNLSGFSFNSSSYSNIYNTAVYKEIYFNGVSLDVMEGVLTPEPFVRGMIMMYSGTSSIPSGWAICDGSNGTPDLRGKFIKAVGTFDDSNKTGGNSSVTLNFDNLPSQIGKANLSLELGKSIRVFNTVVQANAIGEELTTQDITWSKGNSINIEPSYYSLIFIMKL